VGSNPDVTGFFFNLPNTSSRPMALGSNQPLIEMGTRNLPGGKGRPTHTADNLTAICEPTVQKMWEPRRLTTLWASGPPRSVPGIALPFFFFAFFNVYIPYTKTVQSKWRRAQTSQLLHSWTHFIKHGMWSNIHSPENFTFCLGFGVVS
jgi:hypothetical protein